MKFLALAVFFFCTSAFAATNGYKLKIVYSENGNPVMSPTINVKEGESASVNHENKTIIEVVAKDVVTNGKPAISLKFKLIKVDKDNKKSVIAEPLIMAVEDEMASIEIGSVKGPEMKLAVTAKKLAVE